MRFTCLASFFILIAPLTAGEFHVSPSGDDANSGSPSAMLRTISEAANRAQPGDTVTVHEGVYRERINPPRGGTSESARITYQAAPGENVTIKGSEEVTDWQFVGSDTWKVTLPNSYFGNFNPYNNLISGDWFTSNGRNHHTGAVYLNGHWLTEAASKSAALAAAGTSPLWFAEAEVGGALLNMGWLQPYAGTTAGTRVDASYFSRDLGVMIAANSEGGHCVGFIDDGEWTRYDTVNFGTNADSLKISAASASTGGIVQARLDGPTGVLLGSVTVPNTGGWQTWQTFTIPIPPTSGVRRVCLVYRAPNFATANTTIYAQFPGKNPNDELTEINVRQSVFYPDEPGLNFITVRGFTLEQAATPWAPPTAEQIGAIGTNWGHGWIIENNTVRYSVCSGISLGKYGDRWDNYGMPSGDGTAFYRETTIQRALANGWQKGQVGGHLVRGNEISNCEQAGIVGSLGCSFSTIVNNHIHDIHVRRLFSGAEMAGIKFHGAIDTQIMGNHIHDCNRGIWLDWMAQGARVSRCLLHGNSASEDLFLEVNHGPILIDHNIFLSGRAIWDASEGEAYVHNLIAGSISTNADGRQTPIHQAHSTTIAGTPTIIGGDTRFYNNILVGSASLAGYNNVARATPMSGNVFLKGAVASSRETSPLVMSSFNPALQIRAGGSGYFLEMKADPAWGTARNRPLVDSVLLGKAVAPNLPFEQPDGMPWTFDTDFFDLTRAASPFPGPFEQVMNGLNLWKVSTATAARTPAGARVMERIHLDFNAASPVGTAGNFSGTPATKLGGAGETWNHITPGNTAGSVTALFNSTGSTSTAGIKWTANYGAYDNSTAAAAYTDLLGDYVYVNTGGQASSTWTFTGLAAYGTYNLVLYSGIGSLSGAAWTVNGETKEASPINSAASLNAGQEFVRFDGVRANGSGEIAIDFGVHSGKSYGEMAGIEIETVALTDASSMAVSQSRFVGGGFEITATGLLPGSRYVLTRSVDLRDGFRTVVGSAFTPAAETLVLTDTAPPPGRAFYRIEEVP